MIAPPASERAPARPMIQSSVIALTSAPAAVMTYRSGLALPLGGALSGRIAIHGFTNSTGENQRNPSAMFTTTATMIATQFTPASPSRPADRRSRHLLRHLAHD